MTVKEESVKDSDSKKEDCSDAPMDWNVENEIHLFTAMDGHKPVGLHKHFHMVCIHDKLQTALNRRVPVKAIWDQLDTMYDMSALDESEVSHFPNEEKDFSLPVPEFKELMKEKQNEVELEKLTAASKAKSKEKDREDNIPARSNKKRTPSRSIQKEEVALTVKRRRAI